MKKEERWKKEKLASRLFKGHSRPQRQVLTQKGSSLNPVQVVCTAKRAKALQLCRDKKDKVNLLDTICSTRFPWTYTRG